MSEDNAALLQATYEAFGRQDMATVLAALDENIVWNAPAVLPHAMPVSGRADVPAFFQNLAGTWEDFSLEIDDFVASGSQAHRRRINKRVAQKTRGSSCSGPTS